MDRKKLFKQKSAIDPQNARKARRSLELKQSRDDAVSRKRGLLEMSPVQEQDESAVSDGMTAPRAGRPRKDRLAEMKAWREARQKAKRETEKIKRPNFKVTGVRQQYTSNFNFSALPKVAPSKHVSPPARRVTRSTTAHKPAAPAQPKATRAQAAPPVTKRSTRAHPAAQRVCSPPKPQTKFLPKVTRRGRSFAPEDFMFQAPVDMPAMEFRQIFPDSSFLGGSPSLQRCSTPRAMPARQRSVHGTPAAHSSPTEEYPPHQETPEAASQSSHKQSPSVAVVMSAAEGEMEVSSPVSRTPLRQLRSSHLLAAAGTTGDECQEAGTTPRRQSRRSTRSQSDSRSTQSQSDSRSSRSQSDSRSTRSQSDSDGVAVEVNRSEVMSQSDSDGVAVEVNRSEVTSQSDSDGVAVEVNRSKVTLQSQSDSDGVAVEVNRSEVTSQSDSDSVAVEVNRSEVTLQSQSDSDGVAVEVNRSEVTPKSQSDSDGVAVEVSRSEVTPRRRSTRLSSGVATCPTPDRPVRRESRRRSALMAGASDSDSEAGMIAGSPTKQSVTPQRRQGRRSQSACASPAPQSAQLQLTGGKRKCRQAGRKSFSDSELVLPTTYEDESLPEAKRRRMDVTLDEMTPSSILRSGRQTRTKSLSVSFSGATVRFTPKVNTPRQNRKSSVLRHLSPEEAVAVLYNSPMIEMNRRHSSSSSTSHGSHSPAAIEPLDFSDIDAEIAELDAKRAKNATCAQGEQAFLPLDTIATHHEGQPPTVPDTIAMHHQGQPPTVPDTIATHYEGQPPTAPDTIATHHEGQPPTSPDTIATHHEGQPPTSPDTTATHHEGPPPTVPDTIATHHEGQPPTVPDTIATHHEGQPPTAPDTTEVMALSACMDGEAPHDVPYFRQLITDHTALLNASCETWEAINTGADLSEEVTGQIRTTVGQAQLLMAQRFKQFNGLVDSCEQRTGDQQTHCSDLQGFWEMIFLQVEDVNLKFVRLAKLQQNGWKEEKPASRKLIKKKLPAASKPKTAASGVRVKSKFAAFRAQMKDQKVAENVPVCTTPPQKAPTDLKTIDFGFFAVTSPVRSPKTQSRVGNPSVRLQRNQGDTPSSSPKHSLQRALHLRSARLSMEPGLSTPRLKNVNVDASPLVVGSAFSNLLTPSAGARLARHEGVACPEGVEIQGGSLFSPDSSPALVPTPRRSARRSIRSSVDSPARMLQQLDLNRESPLYKRAPSLLFTPAQRMPTPQRPSPSSENEEPTVNLMAFSPSSKV